MPSSFSQIRLHLQLTVMYLEVCSIFDILLLPIPNIGFQLKLANQAWPTFEVCTDWTEMLDFLFSDQYFHLLDFLFSINLNIWKEGQAGFFGPNIFIPIGFAPLWLSAIELVFSLNLLTFSSYARHQPQLWKYNLERITFF